MEDEYDEYIINKFIKNCLHQNIVTDKKTSKKLKELGVPQRSFFYYSIYEQDDMLHVVLPAGETNFDEEMANYMSAFTADELLPHIKGLGHLACGFSGDYVSLSFQPEYGTDNSYGFGGKTLVEVLAKAVIASINEERYSKH